jgi:hypothetical protein
MKAADGRSWRRQIFRARQTGQKEETMGADTASAEPTYTDLATAKALAGAFPDGDERRWLMNKLRQEGWTLQAVADLYGLTRERVRQITSVPAEAALDARRSQRLAELRAWQSRPCSICGQEEVGNSTTGICRLCRDSRAHLNGTRYNQGCRCDDCIEANRRRMRRRRAQMKADFLAGRVSPPHGRRSTYINYGCRCRECTAAHSEACRRYYQERGW